MSVSADQDYFKALKALGQTFGRTYYKNSVVFYEGEIGSEVFIILSGKIGISTTFGKDVSGQATESPKDGMLHQLATLSAGEIFGEMAILDDLPRSATATAQEDTEVIVFTRTDFYLNIERYPRLAVKMLKLLGTRMRQIDEKLKRALAYLANKNC